MKSITEQNAKDIVSLLELTKKHLRTPRNERPYFQHRRILDGISEVLMKMQEHSPVIVANTLIPAGNYFVSVGIEITEIAILSKSSGDFVTFKNIKRSRKLTHIKRKFAKYLSCEDSFFFSHMGSEAVNLLIKKLKR